MYYVYVIQSKRTKELYFGYSHNLEERLKRHNKGYVSATVRGVPWEFVYLEGYKDEKDARQRELKLKQYGNARTYVKKRLKRSIST